MGAHFCSLNPFPQEQSKHSVFEVGVNLGIGDTLVFLALFGDECEALGVT